MGLKLLRWWKQNYYVCHCKKYEAHASNIDVLHLHICLCRTKKKTGNNRQSQLTWQTSLEVLRVLLMENLRIPFFPFWDRLLLNGALLLTYLCNCIVVEKFLSICTTFNRNQILFELTKSILLHKLWRKNVKNENEVRMTLISSNQLQSSLTVLFFVLSFVFSFWIGSEFQSRNHLSLNAIIDYYASFFHALKQRSARFSYRMMPFCLFCCLYNGRSFIWTKKNNHYKRHSFNICCVGVENTRKWWEIFDNGMSSIRMYVNTCRNSRFFLPIFSLALFWTHLQRTGQLVSNSKVVFIFACSIIIFYWIFMSSFQFQTLLSTMSRNRFDSLFFLSSSIFHFFFLSLRKLFFVSKSSVGAFFSFNIDYYLCFCVFQVQAKYFLCFSFNKKILPIHGNWKKMRKMPAEKYKRNTKTTKTLKVSKNTQKKAECKEWQM